MFEAIVSMVHNAFRAVASATHRAPWFAPIAILALVLVW
jgi:hypothetical protein